VTAIDFDPATGRLRLPAAEFTQLVDPGAGATGLVALTSAGVLVDLRPHPLLAPGLAAVRSPVCTLDVRVAGAAGVQTHQGWVAAEAAGFLLQSHGEIVEFLTTGPTFVPAGLARILALGPRPRPSVAPFTTPADLVDQLLNDDPSIRAGAIEALPAAATVAAESGWRASHSLVAWTGIDGHPAGRDLVLLDTPVGLFVAERDPDVEEQARWSTVCATDVWRALITLLPGDEELGQPPGDAS
jgi:hypothetical protein